MQFLKGLLPKRRAPADAPQPAAAAAAAPAAADADATPTAGATSAPLGQPRSRSFQMRQHWSSRRLVVPASVPEGGQLAQAPGPLILATSSVFPPNEHSQDDYCEMFLARHVLSEADQAWVRRVFAATMIETSQSYLPRDQLFKKMSRPEYIDYIKPALQDMGMRAAEDVLAQWGGDRGEITHIVWGTMTGSIHAPTMDVVLTRELGLKPSVKRLNVEGMGCLTGFRCLNIASEIALAGTNNKVLVVVCDVRSALQNQLRKHEDYAPINRSDVVVVSLFRDSGGAALVASPGPRAAGSGTSRPLYEILDGRSYVIPDTSALVDMREGEDATISLYISKDLPDKVKEALPDLVRELLEPSGVALADCCFAIHTGGPKVIRNVAAALGVEPETLGASWHVMQRHGNLSGSSNLVVLDHLRRLAAKGAEGVEEKEYCVCVSMGPGVCVEAVLLRTCGWDAGLMARRTTSKLLLPAAEALDEVPELAMVLS